MALVDDDVPHKTVAQLTMALEDDVNDPDTEADWDERYMRALSYPARVTKNIRLHGWSMAATSSTGMTHTKNAKFYKGEMIALTTITCDDVLFV